MGRWLCWIVLVVCGCTTVAHQPYNQAANTQLKRIGLVAVSNPAQYSVNVVFQPGASLGVIGVLLMAGDLGNKSKAFTQQQVDKYLRLGPELTAALAEELAAAGSFQVVAVDGGTAARTGFLKQYPPVECDAYLDVVIRRAGYWAQYSSSPLLPTMFVPVRLVDARAKTVLFSKEVFLTDGHVPDGATQVYPDANFAFESFAALKADPERAGEGLKQAARMVARQIVSDLK